MRKKLRCGLQCETVTGRRHRGRCWFAPHHKGQHVCTTCIKEAFERALGPLGTKPANDSSAGAE